MKQTVLLTDGQHIITSLTLAGDSLEKWSKLIEIVSREIGQDGEWTWQGSLSFVGYGTTAGDHPATTLY